MWCLQDRTGLPGNKHWEETRSVIRLHSKTTSSWVISLNESHLQIPQIWSTSQVKICCQKWGLGIIMAVVSKSWKFWDAWFISTSFTFVISPPIHLIWVRSCLAAWQGSDNNKGKALRINTKRKWETRWIADRYYLLKELFMHWKSIQLK